MTTSYESLVEACSSALMNQIRAYNEEQLKILLADDAGLDAMIKQIPQLNSLTADKETRLAMLRSLADQNLAVESRLNQLRANLDKTANEARNVVSEVKALEMEADGVTEPTSLDTCVALLQAAAQQAEDESEKLCDSLEDSEITLDDFIKEYERKRTICHLRKIKAEKLAESIRQPANPLLARASGMPRPLSQPVIPHPTTGYRQVGAFIYPPNPGYRHSGFM